MTSIASFKSFVGILPAPGDFESFEARETILIA